MFNTLEVLTNALSQLIKRFSLKSVISWKIVIPPNWINTQRGKEKNTFQIIFTNSVFQQSKKLNEKLENKIRQVSGRGMDGWMGVGVRGQTGHRGGTVLWTGNL